MNIAIIGSAGRKEDGPKMNKNLYKAAVNACGQEINKLGLDPTEITLYAAGAAWMDHVNISLFKQGKAGHLRLILPCEWDAENVRYVDNGSRDFRTNPGGTCNYYHRQFTQKMGGDTLRSIHELLNQPRVTKVVIPGLHARNLETGKADLLIALTWGEGTIPKDGGTFHTWQRSTSPTKLHIPLSSLI